MVDTAHWNTAARTCGVRSTNTPSKAYWSGKTSSKTTTRFYRTCKISLLADAPPVARIRDTAEIPSCSAWNRIAKNRCSITDRAFVVRTAGRNKTESRLETQKERNSGGSGREV